MEAEVAQNHLHPYTYAARAAKIRRARERKLCGRYTFQHGHTSIDLIRGARRVDRPCEVGSSPTGSFATARDGARDGEWRIAG